MDIGLAFPKDAQIKAWRRKAEDALVAVELWKTRAAYFEAALHKIADMDYRGNRSAESSIAFKVLQHQSEYARAMNKAAQARPSEEIEREFMNQNSPHNEGHWWAIREIYRLREENAQLRMDHIAAHRVSVSTITYLEKLLVEARHNSQFNSKSE